MNTINRLSHLFMVCDGSHASFGIVLACDVNVAVRGISRLRGADTGGRGLVNEVRETKQP